MEGPSTPAKKRHRPSPGKDWDGGSLEGRQTATDNPQSRGELKQRVLDAAWQAIGDTLSPPRAKGIPPTNPVREGSKSTVNMSVIGEPITWPHAERRPHHLSQLPAAPHNRSLKCSVGHNAFRRPIIS